MLLRVGYWGEYGSILRSLGERKGPNQVVKQASEQTKNHKTTRKKTTTNKNPKP